MTSLPTHTKSDFIIDTTPSFSIGDVERTLVSAPSNESHSSGSTIETTIKQQEDGTKIVIKKKKQRLSKPSMADGRRTPKVTKEKLCALVHYISINENGGKGAHKADVAKRAGYLSSTTPAFSMAITRQKRNGLIFEDPDNKKWIDVTDLGRQTVLKCGFTTEDLLAPPPGITTDTGAAVTTMAAAPATKRVSKSAAAITKKKTKKKAPPPPAAAIVTTNEQRHIAIRETLKNHHPKAVTLFNLLSDGLARTREEIADELDFDSQFAAGLSYLLGDMRDRGLIECRREVHIDFRFGGSVDWIMLTDGCFPSGRP